MLRILQIVRCIAKCGAAVYCLLASCQVMASLVFYWRSRKVKQISCLPKLIMGLANVEVMMLSLNIIAQIFLGFKVPTVVNICR